jgi:hypothetical protein
MREFAGMLSTFFSVLPAVAYVLMVSGYGLTVHGAPTGARCFFDGRALAISFALPLLVTTVGLLAGATPMDVTLCSIGAFLAQVSFLLGGIMDGNNRCQREPHVLLSVELQWPGLFITSHALNVACIFMLCLGFMFMFAILFAVPVLRTVRNELQE